LISISLNNSLNTSQMDFGRMIHKRPTLAAFDHFQHPGSPGLPQQLLSRRSFLRLLRMISHNLRATGMGFCKLEKMSRRLGFLSSHIADTTSFQSTKRNYLFHIKFSLSLSDLHPNLLIQHIVF